MAERVNHELGADGYTTEVFLRRNMLPGEPKRPSAIDKEREVSDGMRSQIRSLNTKNRVSAENGDTSAFHIGQNMDGETEFVSSAEENASVVSSGESVTRNIFLAKSEENAADYSESSGNRIEGYYYFIKNCLDFEKSETRYSKNRNMLIKDLNMVLASLFRLYGYHENIGNRNKVVSYSFYIRGMREVVAYVVTVPNYGYSEKAQTISEGISSVDGIDSFVYIRD